MSEMIESPPKRWADYTQEERENTVDLILVALRKLMVDPQANFNVKQEKPVERSMCYGGWRHTGMSNMTIEVTAPLKPFCRRCGNFGRLPQLGVHEPKDWPLCSCEFGERLRKGEL